MLKIDKNLMKKCGLYFSLLKIEQKQMVYGSFSSDESLEIFFNETGK